MPKRGETRPYRVRYVWPAPDIKGTETRGTESEARDFLAQLERNAGWRNSTVRWVLEHRELGELDAGEYGPEDFSPNP